MDPGTKPKEFYRDKNGMHPLFVLPADVAAVAADLEDLAGAGRTTETVKANADAVANLAGAGRTTETVVNSVQKTGSQIMAGPLEITQPGSKYYSPVSGEPSLGTPHPHNYTIQSGGLAIGTYTYNLGTLTGLPAGTKRIYAYGLINAAGGAGGVIGLQSNSGDEGIWQNTQAANINIGFSGEVLLDSDLILKVVVGGLNLTNVVIIMKSYDI